LVHPQDMSLRNIEIFQNLKQFWSQAFWIKDVNEMIPVSVDYIWWFIVNSPMMDLPITVNICYYFILNFMPGTMGHFKWIRWFKLLKSKGDKTNPYLSTKTDFVKSDTKEGEVRFIHSLIDCRQSWYIHSFMPSFKNYLIFFTFCCTRDPLLSKKVLLYLTVYCIINTYSFSKIRNTGEQNMEN
jgi:hypothetical protein